MLHSARIKVKLLFLKPSSLVSSVFLRQNLMFSTTPYLKKTYNVSFLLLSALATCIYITGDGVK